MSDRYDQRRERESRYFQERRLARMIGGDEAVRAAIGRQTRESLADIGIFSEAGNNGGTHRTAKTLLGLAGVALTAYLEYRNQRRASEAGEDTSTPE